MAGGVCVCLVVALAVVALQGPEALRRRLAGGDAGDASAFFARDAAAAVDDDAMERGNERAAVRKSGVRGAGLGAFARRGPSSTSILGPFQDPSQTRMRHSAC